MGRIQQMGVNKVTLESHNRSNKMAKVPLYLEFASLFKTQIPIATNNLKLLP